MGMYCGLPLKTTKAANGNGQSEQCTNKSAVDGGRGDRSRPANFRAKLLAKISSK